LTRNGGCQVWSRLRACNEIAAAVFLETMPQSPGKTKTHKAQKIELVAKNPRKIKAAIRAWGAASDKEDSDPLQLDDAPPWVEQAWAEVVKVLLPGNQLPTSGEWKMELLGELMGRLQAFGKLYAGEIPITPEVQAQFDRLEKFTSSQPPSPKRTARQKVLVRDLQARVAAVQEGIPNVMKAVMASSHEDSKEFQRGLQRGLNLSSDELVSLNVFERHTRTFFVLALFWRVWVTCKSLREVHGHLCKAVGEDKIGGFKNFEKNVARKIGLTIRGRGRPSGKK